MNKSTTESEMKVVKSFAVSVHISEDTPNTADTQGMSRGSVSNQIFMWWEISLSSEPRENEDTPAGGCQYSPCTRSRTKHITSPNSINLPIALLVRYYYLPH